MSTPLSNHDILKRVLNRIPVGDTFDYTSCPAHILKVDHKEINIWVGNKSGQIPQIVKHMIDVAEQEGYKITYTIVAEDEEFSKLLDKKTQVGMDAWFK